MGEGAGGGVCELARGIKWVKADYQSNKKYVPECKLGKSRRGLDVRKQGVGVGMGGSGDDFTKEV